jgi:hypothetical protein
MVAARWSTPLPEIINPNAYISQRLVGACFNRFEKRRRGAQFDCLNAYSEDRDG